MPYGKCVASLPSINWVNTGYKGVGSSMSRWINLLALLPNTILTILVIPRPTSEK